MLFVNLKVFMYEFDADESTFAEELVVLSLSAVGSAMLALCGLPHI